MSDDISRAMEDLALSTAQQLSMARAVIEEAKGALDEHLDAVRDANSWQYPDGRRVSLANRFFDRLDAILSKFPSGKDDGR